MAALALYGKHRIIVSDDSDPKFRAWLSELTEQHRDEWNLILTDGYVSEAHEPAERAVFVVPDGDADWSAYPPKLPLTDAAGFLQLPFLALLENWSSDKGFLLSVATNEQRDFLNKMVARGALQFENGGGISNMPKRVQSLTQTVGTNLRMWAMFDGDALRPGAPSADSERLRVACESGGVPHHQLSRRCIENYLPQPVITSWANRSVKSRPDRTRKLRAFYRMNEAQRFHFNMKNGFRRDAGRTDATADNLYNGVSAADRTCLADGFDDGIAESFGSGDISEIDLRADGSWDELSSMVSKLVALVR